ncbi:MAG: hypothetical protein Q9208_000610 [Pyrenodesmia sp. 3 TL-2023]
MIWPIVARLALLLLLFQPSIQTNIEYFDTPRPEDAHILQKCRFLQSGDCCVPVDLLILPHNRRETFRPFKVVFEYFEKSALYVFAGEDETSACGGPSVYGYKDPTSQLHVKGFVARTNQWFSGALFAQDRGPMPVGRIRLPWSITFRSVMYYQSSTHPLLYRDLQHRQFIQAVPQFSTNVTETLDPVEVGSIADS